jgi:hypothetical protein
MSCSKTEKRQEVRVQIDDKIALKSYCASDPDYPGIHIEVEGPKIDYPAASVEIKDGMVNIYVWEASAEDYKIKVSYPVSSLG